jgi:hypothetical protein
VLLVAAFARIAATGATVVIRERMEIARQAPITPRWMVTARRDRKA